MKVVFRINSKGVQTEHSLNLNTSVFLGRSRSCGIQLQDVKVSSKHCQFYLKKDRLEITDENSKNGTYLNGIRIEQSEVFIGDQIIIGDTLITIEESKMSAESVEVLTFPGPSKERIDFALRADFTGARIQNQQYHERVQAVAEVAAHEKEVSLRKKAHSKIRLSKQEIRARYKTRSFFAAFIDSAFLGFSLTFPVLMLNDQLMPVLLIGLAAVLGIGFFVLTFKFMKFTIGEQITGIQSLYNKQ